MSIDWIVALHIAGILAALYLLLWEGDEEWYFPIFAVVTVVWVVPIATGLVLSFVAPYVPNPLYIYGFYDFPREWVVRIKATAAAAEAAAVEVGNAMGAVAIAMSVLHTLMFIGAVLAAPVTGGASLVKAIYAIYAWRYLDPVFQLINAAFQAAAGVYMTFHLLEVLAKWAEVWFGPLTAAGLFLLLFRPTRAWGALLTGIAMAFYVAAAVGAYLSPFGLAVAQWAEAVALWAKSAPNATGSLAMLAVQGEGIALLRYHNTASPGDLYERLNKFWLSAGLDNRSLPREIYEKIPKPLFKNASDWAVAGPGAPAVLYVGRKNFTGVDSPRPYAVYVWLDYPISISTAGWRLQYPNLNIPAPNLTMPSGENSAQWLERVRGEESRLLSDLYPIYVADTRNPSHWRLLTADVRTIVIYNNAVLLNETRPGAVGVWGWLVAPDGENYSGGNVTIRKGLLKYDPGWNSTVYQRPVARSAESNFTLWLKRAPSPTLGDVKTFYKWKETCEWCCGWTCDANGNCWCSQWCSATRDVWQEPRWSKITYDSAASVPALRYLRPWVPENQTTHGVVVDYVRRDWRVTYEIKHGDWSGDGTPPAGATCWTHDNSTYKRVKLWDVRRTSSYVYGFAWLKSVNLHIDDKRIALPDYYDEAPDADSDGVPVVNLLRGAEHDQYCSVDVETLPPPRWGALPRAVSNLTRVNRDLFFLLLSSGNYSRRYTDRLRSLVEGVELPDGGGEFAYFSSIGPRPYYPMPEAEPRNFTAYNFYTACIRFDWRGEKNAVGRLTLWPGGSTWLFGYTLGDSNATRESLVAMAERWRWFFNHPPPPPPAALAAEWQIPWNNWTSLPYTPARTKPMPPPDPRWGVSLWDVGLVLNPLELFGKLLGRLWWSVYVALLAPVIVFEALAAVFGFPAITRYLVILVNHVVQDLTYWLGIRLMLRSKLIVKLAKLGSPVKRASVRLVRKLAHRGWAKYREKISPVEWAIRRRFEAYIEEKMYERIEKMVEKVLKTLERAEQAVERGIATAAEAGRRAYELGKRIHAYMEMDAVAWLRRLWPSFDARFEQWMHEFAMKHPVLYTLFLSQIDDKPRWLALINLDYLRRLYVEGRITREQYEEIYLTAQVVRAARAAQWARYVRERVDEEAVLRAAMEAHRRALERSTGAFYALLYDLAVLDVSDPRAAVERLESRVKAVYEPMAKFHWGAFERLWAVFKLAVGERREVKTPRELAQWLLENREAVLQAGAGLVDTWREVWIERWSSAKVPYSPYRYAEVEALRHIQRELPTLYIIGLARGVVLGGRSLEEARRVLETGKARLRSTEVAAVSPGEAVKPSFFGESVKELGRARAGDIELVRVERAKELEAERWALRLLERAVKAVEEGDEEGRRRVLEETWRFAREFGERYLWVGDVGERIYTVERPGAVEMRRAFDEALKVFVERGREEAIKLLRERAEEARRFYQARGGVDEVKTITRLEREYVRLLEEMPEGVAGKVDVVKPGERASLLREVLDKTADVETAKRALELYARGEARLAEAAQAMRRIVVEAQNTLAELERIAQQHTALRRQAEEELSRYEQHLIQLEKAINEYVRTSVNLSRAKEEIERLAAEYKKIADEVAKWRRGLEARAEELERLAAEAERAGRVDEAGRLRAEAEYLRDLAELSPEGLVKAERALREAEVRRAEAEAAFNKAKAELDAAYIEATVTTARLRELLARLREVEKSFDTPSALYYIRDLQGAGAEELARLLYRAVAAERSVGEVVDPLALAAARLYLERLEGLKSGDRRLVAELAALAELLGRLPREEVAKAFKGGGGVKLGEVRVDRDALAALVEAFRTAERIVQLERDAGKAKREARRLERAVEGEARRLKPPEVSTKLAEEHASAVRELSQRLAQLEEAVARGEWVAADRIAGEVFKLYQRVRAIEGEAVGRAVVRETRLEAPGEVGLRAAAYEIIKLAQAAPLAGEEKETVAEAIRRVFEKAASVYGRERVVEAVRQLRRELEPYSTVLTIAGREHEVVLFKQAGGGAFARAVAYVLLEEVARRVPEAEALAKRLRALESQAVAEFGRERWEEALKTAREALRYKIVDYKPGEVKADAAVVIANYARRLPLETPLRDLEAAREAVRYIELWRRARAGEEGLKIGREMREIAQRRPELVRELAKALAKGVEKAEDLPKYLYKRYVEEAQRRAEELRQKARELRREAKAAEREAEEARNRLEAMLAQIGGGDAEFMIKLASISDAVAEAVKALEKAAPELEKSRQWEKTLERARSGGLGEKDVERFRAVVRDLARAWEAYPRLLEYLQRPGVDANLYHLYKAARDLGLGDVARFIALVGAARGVHEMYGERLYQNPLYEALLPYLGWREWKALLRAPMGVHVANRMGPQLAKAAFTRYPIFDLYGNAFREISILADLPLTVGMPVRVRVWDIFPPERSYPDKVAKYVAEWTFAGLAEGLRRYYNTREGVEHRAAAHLMALAGRAIALYKAYEELMYKAGRAAGVERDALAIVAHAARAKAAYEEIKMARLHLKYAERLASLDAERAERITAAAERHYEALTAEASRRYRESLREIKNILEKYEGELRKEFLREVSRYLGGIVYKADDVHAWVKAADPMRLARFAGEAAGLLAGAEEAYRVYRRLEKYLSRPAPSSPLPDYGVVPYVEGPARYKPTVENAAVAYAYHWLRARAGLKPAVDAASLAYWHREGEVKLPREAVAALKRLGAYKKAKSLAGGRAPLEVVRARLEEDVYAVVAAARATPIERELGELAAALAFHWMAGAKVPAPVVEWIRRYRPEDWKRAREAFEAYKRGVERPIAGAEAAVGLTAEEALARFRAVVSKFVGEAVAVARFSPGAYQKVRELAEELAQSGPLGKYLAARVVEALRGVEPLRAPDAEAFARLPEAVREGLSALVKNLEERMLREGYYDRALEAFYGAFGLGAGRRDPRDFAREAAEGLRRAWRVELREGEALVENYREAAGEAYATALRELEEIARAPLQEAVGRAGRAAEALAEALSYLVEDRFLGEGDVYDGDRLAGVAMAVVREVLGVESAELAAAAVEKALDRWASISGEVYMRYLERGQLPVGEGLARVFRVENVDALKMLARRLAVAFRVGESGEVVGFVYHPALGEVVGRVEALALAKAEEGRSLEHLGIAPAEFIGGGRAWERFEAVVEEAFAAALAKGNVYNILGRVMDYWVYKWLQGQGRYKPVFEMFKGVREVEEKGRWWEVVKAAVGYEVGRRLREYWRQSAARDKTVLWEWGVPGELAPGALLALAGVAKTDGGVAYYKLGVLRAFLKWLASPFQLVPEAAPEEWRTDNPLFTAAVRLYAEAMGKKFEEVWSEAAARLRAIQPPGLREEEEAEEARAQRREKTAADRKTAEKAGEKAAEEARGAAGRVEKPAGKAAEGSASAGGGEGVERASAGAAGVIPPGLSDLSAVGWLVRYYGRGEWEREVAEAFKRAVGRAVERVKARYGHRLYKAGGEALVELANRAAEEAFSLAKAAVESPEAVRYMLLLLDNAEGPVFGLRPRSPLEADAARVFARVGEYVRRAEAEFGAGLLVWSYARAVAEAVLREAERIWDKTLRGIATVETALKATAIAAVGAAGFAVLHDALHATAVVSATATAIALAGEGAFEKAVEYVKRAAEAVYEAAREIFEKAKIALERLYELFLEAVARALDYVKAHWLILAATAAGLVSWIAAQQLDFSLWQDYAALNASAIAGLAKAAGVDRKRWEEVENALLAGTVGQSDVVERIAQFGLDRGVVEKALGAYSALGHAVRDEDVKNAVTELRRLASHVQAMNENRYKKVLEEASKAWYEQRDPAALWALAALGARETGRGLVKVFEDDDDRTAYLIASFTLLSRLGEFVELRGRVRKALERFEEAVRSGRLAVADVWGGFNALAEAEERARRVANELNAIAHRLERAGFSGVAERLRVAMERVTTLAEATLDDLSALDVTRGERAVAALLSLVASGLFGVSVERALAERGEKTAGALGVASAVRSTPISFYSVFKSIGGEGSSEAGKLALRIASLLTDPLVKTALASRRDVEVRIEERVENGKRRIYVSLVDGEGREVVKAAWEVGKRLLPLWAEGEAVKPIEEVANLVEAASSGSKPLAELGGEEWGRAVEALRRVKGAVETTARAVAIGALPTDAVLQPGIEYIRGNSSYLSQAFTYLALAEGGMGLERVYPSEEGLRAMWRIEGRYTKTVGEILRRGRAALEGGGADLKAALADVRMGDEVRTALEAAAGELWRRVGELLRRWNEAEKGRDVNTLNSLGKYIRVLLPLAYAVEAYRRGELSRGEVALAVAFAVLYDGSVLRGEILLYIGGPEHEEEPILMRDHFAVFWLWALRELGLKPSSVRRGTDTRHIVFRGGELERLLEALVPALSTLHQLRDALAEFADALKAVSGEVVRGKFAVDWAYDVRKESFMRKLEEIIAMVEGHVHKTITVERDPLDANGKWPKTVIRFKMGGEEMGHINVYWNGKVLQAYFLGSRGKAERLASVIRALGGEAKVKPIGAKWNVHLYTDGIVAIRHGGWLNAVKSFVEELYGRGLIDEERYKQLVWDIEAGPNVVKFAGVELSVYYRGHNILVSYQPTKESSKNAAVDALRARGLVEGVHFSVTKSGKNYTVYITYEGLREIQRMALSGDVEAERFVRDLEDVLRRRYGQSAVDKLIEVLAPAREEGTVELPLAVYDERGNVVARVVDLRYEFVEGGRPVGQCAGENCRLRITAEYEAGEERRELKIEWYWQRRQIKRGQATATYYYEMSYLKVKDDVEAAVLKALTGKDVEVGKVQLYGGDLNALRRFKALKDAVDKWREGRPRS